MIEIRWHGRGGQGAVTSVELLATAAIDEGKYAQAFPSFGPERRGAPVEAFNRVGDKQIKVRSRIYHPDVVVVLDGTLVGTVNVILGLKEEGLLIVNSPSSVEEVRNTIGFAGRIGVVDATGIAWQNLGVPITNTTMLGALVKATGVVGLSSLRAPIEHRFGKIAAKNLQVMQQAHDEIKLG